MATLLLAIAFLGLAACAQEECNGVTPIYVDFHDRNVSNSDQHIQYGLFIGVGTPSQNQSLWPSIRRNETTFSGPGFCDESDLSRCLEQTHGSYRPDNSNSFREESFRPLDSTSVVPASVGVMGTDTLNIFTHYFDPSPPNVTHIPDFPVTQLTNYTSSDSPWFGPSGLLGLGPSAPILQRLVDLGEISSRSFGLYIGSAYPRAGGAINGSLTLGGYDSGRLEGKSHNFTLVTDYNSDSGETPFRVTVDSLVLNDLNNNNESIPLTSDPFTAYLTTDQYSMTFTQSINDAFLEHTSASSEPQTNLFSEPTFHLPDTANFSLTLTLSTGLSITIPAEELRNISNASPLSAVPSPLSAPSSSSSSPSSTNTSVNTNDNSIRVIGIRQSTSAPPALLGTIFLSHLYLTTNYDASPLPTFYLNHAKPHGPYVMTQALCRGLASKAPIEAPETHISSWDRNGTIGAVLGGVIGGIALGLLGWWLWVVLRRRQQQASLSGDGDEEGNGKVIPDLLRVNDQPVGKRARLVALVQNAGGRGRGLGRGWSGKGKDKAAQHEAAGRGARKSSSSSDSGSETTSHSTTGDEHETGGQAYAMQQFAPVAVPSAYSHPGERYYGQPEQCLINAARGGHIPLLMLSPHENLPHYPPNFQHAEINPEAEAAAAAAAAAPAATTTEHTAALIGQAISTPPALKHKADQQQPFGRLHTTSPRTPNLRPLSPISPLSPLLPSIAKSTSPSTSTSTSEPSLPPSAFAFAFPFSANAAAAPPSMTRTPVGEIPHRGGGGGGADQSTAALSPTVSRSTMWSSASSSAGAYSEAAWTGEARLAKRLKVGRGGGGVGVSF